MVAGMSGPVRRIPREAGRGLFGGDPAGYDAARPEYPARVFEILRERAHITASSRVLEIGPGTGLATRGVATLGVGAVVAVEPDGALAGHLRATWLRSTPLEVVVQSFEEVELPADGFDLAYAATSFHWVDPAIGLAKVHTLLRAGGLWAMFWNVFGDPNRPDLFHEATRSLLEPLECSPSGPSAEQNSILDVDAQTRQLAEASFVEIESELLPWTLELDQNGVRALYGTYSAINRLGPASRDRILDELARIADHDFGDRVERNLVTAIYTARRPDL
jgi:SAM-dependent methyltransferase